MRPRRKHRLRWNALARGGSSFPFPAALAVQVFGSGPLDTVAVVLLALPVLPWAASFLETAELLGGGRLTLRHVAIRRTSTGTSARDSFSESELRRLLAVGLIQRLPGPGIRTMHDQGDDLREHFSITEEGRREHPTS